MPAERWTDEMLACFASTVSVTLAGIGNAQLGLSQRLDQFIARTDETIARLEQTITELKTDREQAHGLDYLLREEQERQGGGSGMTQTSQWFEAQAKSRSIG